MLLLVVSMNTFAEWTRAGYSADGESTQYVDLESIKKKGHKVKLWELTDEKTIQKFTGGKEYLSAVSRQEIDCEEETSRILDLYLYSGNMRQGEVVDSVTNSKEEPISIMPGSIKEGLFKIACGKK